ncbi:helix-turn-helix transcriptional regulator [Geodermatophilus sp. SYSU D01045]
MTTKLLSQQDVADLFGVPLATVRYWRVQRTGPRAAVIGKHVRYRECDVEAWLAQQFERATAGPDPTRTRRRKVASS